MTSKYNGHVYTERQRMEKMDELTELHKFCEYYGIHHSATMDSYYFSLNGKKYRVSNHSVEASNAHAYSWDGRLLRAEHHPMGREPDTVYIHAGKARIVQIYTDLLAGKELDGRGYPKGEERPKKTVQKAPVLVSGRGKTWNPIAAYEKYERGKARCRTRRSTSPITSFLSFVPRTSR